MWPITILFSLLAVSAHSAPTQQQEPASLPANVELRPELQPLKEFLILTPKAQLQLQPALKLQQSVIQPLALYGTAAGTRQADVQSICNQIQQGADTFQQVFPITFPVFGGGGGGDDERRESMASSQLRTEKLQPQQAPELDAETIPVSKTPVAIVPPPQHRFYTVAGPPQFFGNVDILQNPLNPIFSFQPLQAIKARSVVDPQGQLIGQNNPDAIRVIAGSQILPASGPLTLQQPIENLQQGGQQPIQLVHVADEVAQNFAKTIAEKQVEIHRQQNENNDAANQAAQNFAIRFAAEEPAEKDQANQEANVKFISPDAAYVRNENLAVVSSNENIAQEAQPQAKTVEDNVKEATI